MLILFLFMMGSNPNIDVGDPVPELVLSSFQGGEYRLPDLVGTNGIFFFILSEDCPYCVEALDTIESLFDLNKTIIALVNPDPNSPTFRRFPHVYRIDGGQLEKYNIQVLPFLVGCKHGSIVIGYHGQFSPDRADWVMSRLRGGQ